MDLFAQASRMKLRFDTPKGQLSVEDLWDLPLKDARKPTTLDNIAVDLHRRIKSANEAPVSFVEPTATNPDNAEDQLRFEIVKHIIGVLLAEKKARDEAAERREKKAKLRDLLQRKRDQELEGKTAEEIEAMIDAIG